MRKVKLKRTLELLNLPGISDRDYYGNYCGFVLYKHKLNCDHYNSVNDLYSRADFISCNCDRSKVRRSILGRTITIDEDGVTSGGWFIPEWAISKVIDEG